LNTYSHLFPHKQQELVNSLECLGVNNTPEPTPPHANPFAVDTEGNQSKRKASGNIIPMPIRKII
jgi:hypothetical protein